MKNYFSKLLTNPNFKGSITRNTKTNFNFISNQIENKISLNKLIKSITPFNPKIASSQAIIYKYNKSHLVGTSKFNEEVYTILKYFFNSISCLISKPIYIFTNNKVIINLCFYKDLKSNNSLSKSRYTKDRNLLSFNKNKSTNITEPVVSDFLLQNNKKFKYLALVLSKIFNKNVEIVLFRLNYPFHDNHMLANAIASNSNKYKFRRIILSIWKKLIVNDPFTLKFNKSVALNNTSLEGKENVSADKIEGQAFNSFTALLTGLKIRIGGRITTEKITPKQTVKTASRGNFVKGKVNFVNCANFTSKNKKGAFNVKVWMSHTFPK